MKVNLIRKNSEKLDGYMNLDPHPSTDDVTACSHENIDAFVDDGEAEEIRACDVIDFLPTGKLMDTMKHWRKKLRLKGKLTIGGTDLREVARSLQQGSISEQSANELLYNVNDTDWDIKRSAGTIEIMVNVFNQLGLKIEEKLLRNNRYIITGTRE